MRIRSHIQQNKGFSLKPRGSTISKISHIISKISKPRGSTISKISGISVNWSVALFNLLFSLGQARELNFLIKHDFRLIEMLL